MSRFDWQTDEEGLLDEPDGPEEPQRPARGSRFFLLLLALLALGGAGYGAARQLEERAQAGAQRVEDDVLATHELVRRSGREADAALFPQLISGANREWGAILEQEVAGGRWLDRPALDLLWQPSPSVSSTVQLSPELSEAEVVSWETYEFAGPSSKEPVILAQTAVYRMGPGRWLYSPPRAAFWGAEQQKALSCLLVSYPERDGALVERLAGDLDQLLASLYPQSSGGAAEEMGCSGDSQLQIRFSSDTTLLHEWNPYVPVATGSGALRLPTPTLLGRPVDEAGYQALRQAYGIATVRAAVARLSGWRCCNGALFFQALLMPQLRQLGLRAWPPPPVSPHELLLRSKVSLDDLAGLWQMPGAEGPTEQAQAAQIVADFLLAQQPGVPLLARQQELGDAAGFQKWLDGFSFGEETARVAWLRYLYQQTNEPAGPPPLALPPSPSLLCGADERARTLYRYDIQGDSLLDLLPGRSFDMAATATTVEARPAGGTIIVDQRAANSNRHPPLSLLLWQAGEEKLLWESGAGTAFLYIYHGLSPDGRYLLLEQQDPPEPGVHYWAVDVDSCLEGSCQWQWMQWQPLWSPDNQHALFADPDSGGLYLGGPLGEGARRVADGSYPFWVDSERYGYFRRAGPDGRLEAILATVTGEADTLFSFGELADAAPGRSPLARARVLRDPAEPGHIFIAAAPRSTREIFLFNLDLASHELTFLWHQPGAGLESLSLSPDGRWFATPGVEGLALYDTEGQQGKLLATPVDTPLLSWSPDGAWLLASGPNLLFLLAPDYNYQRATFDGRLHCGAITWPTE